MRCNQWAAVVALLAACLLAAAAPPAAAAAALPAGRPDPLGRLRSWQEAWAALYPYAAPTQAGVPCNTTGPTVAAVCAETAIRSLWTQWKARYGLRYTGTVETLRYGYFRNTVRALVLKLATCPRTLWVGLNFRADWSPNELRLNRKLFVPTIKPPMPVKNVALPTMWDWRRAANDKVTPAKDQGRCGSAFAFAAVAAVESKLLIQYGKTNITYPIDLSEQQVVDCVRAGQGSYRSAGCEGGSLEEPLDYAARQFLVKEALYPYTSGSTNSSGTCNQARIASATADDRVQLTGSGYRQVQQWSATALREAVRVSPVMVGIYVPDDSLFEFYSGGVWPANSCVLPTGAPSSARTLVNHALLVVGYDMTIPGNHHWIVKNSYGRGEEWGEDGFGRIAMMPDNTYGTCFMYYYMITPTELVPTGLPVVPEPARTSLRLVNSNKSNTTAGRLEVLHNTVWGTVCSDAFNDVAATIVCKQIGLGNAGTAVPGAFYGQGASSSPVWLDEVGCSGSEARLEVCPHSGWGATNCGHKEDVGVVCRTEAEVTARLVSPAKSTTLGWAGRLEVKYRGAWVPACASGLNNAAASVICKQLNRGAVGTVVPGSVYGPGTGIPRLRSISCTGGESKWESCRRATWGNGTCGAAGDVGVWCPGSTEVLRLVSGSATTSGSTRLMQGRVEVRLWNGRWTSVCHDRFSDASASVVCRQLKLASKGFVVPNAVFGESSGAISWDNVACTGSEATLQQCPRAPALPIPCTHQQDVGVMCAETDPRVRPAVEVRLENGTSTAGRLVVKFAGIEGTVCADRFGSNEATVACRQLGLSGLGTVVSSGTYGPGSGPTLMDNVRCLGNETSLAHCKHSGWGVHNCQHVEDVGISCVYQPMQLRLVGGRKQFGRLEVFTSKSWGSVCDRSFSREAAEVVCRDLGMGLPALTVSGAFFGPSSGPVHYDTVACEGSEARLESCVRTPGSGASRCTHAQDVSVACDAAVTLRLADGTSANNGRLEAGLHGIWGQVLVASNQPTTANLVATVACRQLGLPTPGRMLPAGTFGTASTQTLLSTVRCAGHEARLEDCTTQWGARSPAAGQVPAAIECAANIQPVPARLIGQNGALAQAGRLELLYNSRWGPVCDLWDSFGSREASAVCRQLGLPLPGRSVGGSYWGASSSSPVLDWRPGPGLGCNGTEATLAECPHGDWGQIDAACSAKSQVGVECSVPPLQIQLGNKSADGLSGRLQIAWQGRLGTVCCNASSCFGDDDTVAGVLCKQLGLPLPGRLVDAAAFGPGAGPVLLDQIKCDASAQGLNDCQFSLNTAACGHAQDVGLVCSAPPTQLRLVGGTAQKSGRLELLVAGQQWGSICNLRGANLTFTDRSASVACRQMGLKLPGRVVRAGAFGTSTGPVFASSFDCSGREARLEACLHGFWGRADGCTPLDDVGIECGYSPPAVKLRLADGVPGQSGRLELLLPGATAWGTVASYPGRHGDSSHWSWSTIDNNFASVACRQLGLRAPGRVVPNAVDVYGEGKGAVLLSNVVCLGNELALQSCAHDGWGSEPNPLGHRHDVGIVCNGGPLP